MQTIPTASIRVFAGDGNGGTSNLLFETETPEEFGQLADTLLAMAQRRKRPTPCPSCVAGYDAIGRQCRYCHGTGCQEA